MLEYTYTARDAATGHKVKSRVQADSEQAAAKLILGQGLSPIEIIAVGGEGSILSSRFKNKIKTKDRILFARQLSTLINAGLPLVQSLRSVGDQTENKAMMLVISNIISEVESGKAFSQALSKHPKIFSQIFLSLVEAGETSGTLDRSLERLAIQQEKDAEITSKVRGAMIYPIIVLFVMGGVVSFMLVSVLPQVKTLYDGIKGAELPLVTKILIWFSDMIISYWWVALIALGFSVFFSRRWVSTPAGRIFFDTLKLRMPPFSKLFQKLYMARFSRTATTLIGSGVPLIQVLEIVSRSINNVLVEKSINTAIVKVKGGKSLSESLKGDVNFLSLVPNMLKIGEESGSLEQMMERTAIYYEQEVENEIKAISTIIEPILMVVLGISAITIVAAILLPIYSLVGKDII